MVAADAIVRAADCTVTRTDAVREQNEKIVRLGKQIPVSYTHLDVYKRQE